MSRQPECHLQLELAVGPFETPDTNLSWNAFGRTYRLVRISEEGLLRRIVRTTAAVDAGQRRRFQSFEWGIRSRAHKGLLLILHGDLRRVLSEGEAAVRQISNCNASEEVRMKNGYGNCIFLGFEKRFGDPAGRVASSDGSWHLRDHNFAQFEVVMMAGIGCQRFRNLFGGCDCHIRRNASSCRPRIIEIEEAPREVGAIIRKQIEV